MGAPASGEVDGGSKRPCKSCQAASSDGLCQPGDVAATRVAVPSEEYSGSWSLMEPIESDPRKEFLPFLFGGEEVDDDPRELLGNGVKRGRVGIPYPRKLVEPVHETPEEACKMLVESLLGGADLNYAGHRSCARKASARVSKEREREESAALAERKVEVGF